jgi:hypothetical protein
VSGTLVVETFGMVALLFIVAGAVSVRLAGRGWSAGGGVSSPPTSPPGWGAALRAAWLPAAAEAFGLTLLAALWFGSLGHGGWLTVFLLVGALAAGPERWLRHRLLQTPARQEVALFLLGLARYALAGWLCAWRLS